MIKFFRQVLTVVFCFSFLSGCSSKKEGNANNSNVSEPKIKLHELGIKTDETQLNANQKQLLSQIENKKIADQNLLFEIILEFHKQDFLNNQQNFSATIDENPLMNYFDPLLDSMSSDTGPHEFKVGYEKKTPGLARRTSHEIQP